MDEIICYRKLKNASEKYLRLGFGVVGHHHLCQEQLHLNA